MSGKNALILSILTKIDMVAMDLLLQAVAGSNDPGPLPEMERPIKKGAHRALMVNAASYGNDWILSGGGSRVRIAFVSQVLVILDLGFVFQNLSVKLVNQGINGCIQIFGNAFHVNNISSQT
jgi:hypothetical protein